MMASSLIFSLVISIIFVPIHSFTLCKDATEYSKWTISGLKCEGDCKVISTVNRADSQIRENECFAPDSREWIEWQSCGEAKYKAICKGKLTIKEGIGTTCSLKECGTAYMGSMAGKCKVSGEESEGLFNEGNDEPDLDTLKGNCLAVTHTTKKWKARTPFFMVCPSHDGGISFQSVCELDAAKEEYNNIGDFDFNAAQYDYYDLLDQYEYDIAVEKARENKAIRLLNREKKQILAQRRVNQKRQKSRRKKETYYS